MADTDTTTDAIALLDEFVSDVGALMLRRAEYDQNPGVCAAGLLEGAAVLLRPLVVRQPEALPLVLAEIAKVSHFIEHGTRLEPPTMH